MDTNPKDTVKDAIERAAMACLPNYWKLSGERIVIQRNLSGFDAFQGLLQAELSGYRVAPAVARLRQALGGIGDPEIEGVRVGKLLPGQRHRDRRAGRAPRRVGDVQRLAAHVHVAVHEDLAGALGHAPLERDVLRMLAHEMAADQLGHLARRVEIDGALDGHEDVQAGPARSLDDRVELHALQQLAQPERDLLALLE